MKNATRVDDTNVNKVERMVGSDLAQVQQVDDGGEGRFTSLDVGSEEENKQSGSGGIRVLCAIRPPEHCLQEDEVYQFA